ncbi:hypothetical protein FOA52_011007 [Chlamydomonas sp. UWO 241]|nr:hypothetical protein FOA52_011007 [Chlamydomonas sp. UWO 241]
MPTADASGLRIAVFDTTDAEKWRGPTLAWFQDMLGRPGDEWSVFVLPRGELPPLEDIMRGKYDVIAIGGSPYSALGTEPWVVRLSQVLPTYSDFGVRIVGCCFGHQILAHALGGRVGRNPSGRFVLKVEDVQFDFNALRKFGLVDADNASTAAAAAAGSGDEAEAPPRAVRTPRSYALSDIAEEGTPGGASPPSPASPIATSGPSSGLDVGAAAAAAAALADVGNSGAASSRHAGAGSSGATSSESTGAGTSSTPAPSECVDAGTCSGATASEHAGPVGSSSPEPSGHLGAGTSSTSVPSECVDTDACSSLGMSTGQLAGAAGSTQGGTQQLCLRLLESHGDQVLELPPGARLLASSSSAPIEMWLLPGRAIAFQFHPEFPCPTLAMEKIHPFLAANGTLSPEEAAESQASLTTRSHQPRPVHAMVRAFMEGRSGGGTDDEEGTAATLDAAVSAACASAQTCEDARGDVAGEVGELVGHLRQGFAAGLKVGSLSWEQLTALNDTAAQRAGTLAEAAGAMAEFSKRLAEKQAGARAAMASVPQLEAALDVLSGQVDALDAHSRQLLQRAGLSEASAAGSMFAWVTGPSGGGGGGAK